MATVTETLRRALLTCGQSRYQVAKAIGVPESTLWRFTTGGKPLRGENIDKLAAHLGLELVTKRGRKSVKGR